MSGLRGRVDDFTLSRASNGGMAPRRVIARGFFMPTGHHARTADQPWRAWYWTARWRRIAKAQLAAEPLCRRCLASGIVTAATVAHHVVPHRGDPELFWSGELESICKPHHDSEAQREERGRGPQQVDEDGWPIGSVTPPSPATRT